MYTPDTKLSDILFAHPSIISVVNRFGIYLGVGDKTVKEICNACDLDVEFFLALINTWLNDAYFPENTLRSAMDFRTILLYLERTDAWYERFQLPNIERHFNALVHNSDTENNNLLLLRKFFLDMRQQLLERISHDKAVLFPALKDYVAGGQSVALRQNTEKIEEIDNEIEDRLKDLSSFFIVHLQGKYDVNLCLAVVKAIFSLSKDMRQNNRIRRRILIPMIEQIC